MNSLPSTPLHIAVPLHRSPIIQHNGMSRARIEEVSDSDPSEGDISDVSDDFDERDILKARPSQVPTAQPSSSQPKPAGSLINPSNIPSSGITQDGTRFQQTQDESKYKDFQCIYPIYFDKSRSRKEGRRVGVENAVENPMAREIINACSRLRLETLFEPAKCHPKDWANPGRVKIKLKGGANSSIKNSMLFCQTLCNAEENTNMIARTSSLHLDLRSPTSEPYYDCHCNTRPRPRRPSSRRQQTLSIPGYTQGLENELNTPLLLPGTDRRWSERELLQRYDGGDAECGRRRRDWWDAGNA